MIINVCKDALTKHVLYYEFKLVCQRTMTLFDLITSLLNGLAYIDLI